LSGRDSRDSRDARHSSGATSAGGEGGAGDAGGADGEGGAGGASGQLSCYDRACRLLALRPHFASELAAKLARRGYPGPEIEQALARLVREGWLDDAAAARGLVASRLARGALGRARLRAELERRGAAPEAVTAALAELPEDDLPAAREAAARWRGKNPAALARHLSRKGFSRRAIFAVLAELAAEPPDDLD
jgi:regulatory protein